MTCILDNLTVVLFVLCCVERNRLQGNMEKALEELAKRLKTLKFRMGKTNDIIAKYDRGPGEATVISNN